MRHTYVFFFFFQMELKDNDSIKYIDIAENSCEAYVRCDTPEAAQFLVQKNYEGKRLTVLKGKQFISYVYIIIINVFITIYVIVFQTMKRKRIGTK